MAKRIKLGLLCLITGICLWGCKSQLQSEDERFETFTQELFCKEVSSDTISLHYTLQEPEKYSIEMENVTLGDFSTDRRKAIASMENLLAALQDFSYEDLSVENQLTYDVLKAYLDEEKNGAYYILYNEPMNAVNGVQTQLPLLLSEFPLDQMEDVKIYLQLLEEVPGYFDSLIAFEQEKARKGLFMPRSLSKKVINQCQAFIDMGENNYLISTFVERLKLIEGLSLDEKSDFIQENARLLETKVIPAYQKLIREIERLSVNQSSEKGLCYLPEGKEYYEHVVKKETGSSRNVEELQALTKAQILADLEAMEKVMGIETASVHILQNAAEEVRENEIAEAMLMLGNLEELMEGKFPELPKTRTQIKMVPDAMEAHLSPAFYMIPELDNTSENVIYINAGYERDELSMFTTLAHEGFPGHLYQTVYYASLEQDPVRNIMSFGGYVEGWATYAEMCSYYLADLPKEQTTFLQKNASIILGLYSLADMGIHYDGWSREDLYQFLSAYGIADRVTSEQIYDLILGDPGNYLKYYIGYLEFLELKKNYASSAGDTFSQMEFHKRVLDVGPAPFDVVEKYLFLF